MTKTNNSNLELKIELRRTVLKAGGFAPVGASACRRDQKLRVLDLFAGGGEIWAALRQEFQVESYLPCDVKPQMPGTLRANVTPLFVEAIATSAINVVDIDTYGEPWEIWAAVARRITRPAAVFLTQGLVGMGQTSHFALEAMGIPKTWKIPVKPEVSHFAARYFITPHLAGLTIRRAWRAGAGNATYFGLLGEPAAKVLIC